MPLASVTGDVPLVLGRPAHAALAYDHGRPVLLEEYILDVARLSATLPDREHVLNLCANRYHFAVTFGAALVRRQRTLMPSTLTPHVIGQVRSAYPDVYCIAEDESRHFGLDVHRYEIDRGAGSKAPATQPMSIPAVPKEHVAAIVFTSGSTGEPTPSHKSWGGLALGAMSLTESLGLAATPGMVLLGTVPPQHMFGLEATICLALQGGVALHAGRPFFPADICAELEALPRPRSLVTTPVHLQALLGGMLRFPAVDSLICATAPLAVALAAEAEKAFAAPVYEMYGCTEAGYVATRRPTESPVWRLAPALCLRQDEAGTWVRGGHVPGEVLLGDVIEILDARRFRLLGRTADMIDIGGKRGSLAHLNHQLKSIEGVHDGAFMMPEEGRRGVVRLIAYVVAPGLSRATLMAALRERIDPAFLPRPLRLVGALPRNEMGKLPRTALAALSSKRPPQRK